jgi:hypothetical protein
MADQSLSPSQTTNTENNFLWYIHFFLNWISLACTIINLFHPRIRFWSHLYVYLQSVHWLNIAFTTLHKNRLCFECYCFFTGSTMPVWVHSTTCICRKNTASSQELCPASLHGRDSVLSMCLCSTLLEYACWRDHYYADQQDLHC